MAESRGFRHMRREGKSVEWSLVDGFGLMWIVPRAVALMKRLSNDPDWFMPLGLWVLVTATAAITGPFLTYELLPPLPRTAYWALIVGLSISSSLGHLWMTRRVSTFWRVISWAPYSVGMAAVIQVINLQVFPGYWRGWPDYLWLFWVVLAFCLLIELADALLKPRRAAQRAASRARGSADPTAALMGRLSPEKRGRLIRLEAQDHRLWVVTTAGTSLILMRMADAEALLAGAEGVRVHRSHWVMVREVLTHARRDGRDILVMSDMSEVPVSRNARVAALQAGLIPARAA
jgi:hypothetical protein